MLGLPFWHCRYQRQNQIGPFGLAVAVMCFILAMIIFLQQRISRYALLVGTVVGWGLWRLCFPSSHLPPGELSWRWFPLGSHGTLMPGIIVTAVMTGLVNISNTYGAIRGTDIFIRIKGRAVLVIAEAL